MRICEANNCIRPVFGTDKNTRKGYCMSHQWMRTDRKTKKPAFRFPKAPIRDFDYGFESQTQLFAWCWDNAKNEKGEIICKYTGEKLNRFANYSMDIFLRCFAHVLPKGKYTCFRLNPKNIRVVFPDFHTIVDQGTSIDRVNHPSWRFNLWNQEVEEMKILYALATFAIFDMKESALRLVQKIGMTTMFSDFNEGMTLPLEVSKKIAIAVINELCPNTDYWIAFKNEINLL